jgi:NADH-quinone oxidoreductase subunit E
VNEADNLAARLKELLGIDFGETTYDGRFTLEKITCFGACDRAPAVRINGKVYGKLDSMVKLRELLRSLV